MPTRDQWASYFADAVRSQREAAGLSVAAMAERMGVDERTYRKYEKGITSPQVIDYCWILDSMGVPIMRQLLNFLHPDVFAQDAGDLDEVRRQMVYYVENVAPDRILRQTYHNLIGQASDNVAPQLEMISALQQLPLIYRVMAVRNILALYELAESRGELMHQDQLKPDIEALRLAASRAETAAKKMQETYTTITED